MSTTKRDPLAADSFIIRPASLSDARLLAELGARTFVETYAHSTTQDNMRAHVAREFSEAVKAEQLADANRATWITEIATSPRGPEDRETHPEAVGYATVRRGSGTDCVKFLAPAQLETIYLVRSMHGRGAGASLIAASLARARGWNCDGLWLGVWENNPRAIGFYERMGFTVVGGTTFLLGDDLQNDLVMALPLDLTTTV